MIEFNKMIVHDYGKFPDNLEYRNGEISELSDYELEELEKRLDLDEVWYWYASGSYEGMGEILMRKGDLYDIHDASHCSCYGPTEHADFNGVPLEKLTEGFTEERWNEVKCLIDLATKSKKSYKIW